MTSIDKATQVMKLVVAQEATRGRAASCQRLAEALAEAGLLAPDLPEPDLDNSNPAHRAEYKEQWEGPVPDVWNKKLPDGFMVQTFPNHPEVQLNFDLMAFEPFSLREARKLARALEAAADRAEKEQEEIKWSDCTKQKSYPNHSSSTDSH